jgi:hypothetical protein
VLVVAMNDHETVRRQRKGNVKDVIQRANHDSASLCMVATPVLRRRAADVPEYAVTIKTAK